MGWTSEASILKGMKQPEREADRSTPFTTGDIHDIVT
jgi:hypothetical protein